ncbi:hypothetical protein, partial [Tropicimonas sp.]|uniref:hypothetical protein n=1 Tax=Tropicimonas sp. TaxID=2067044 RepID=UPI003A848F5E
MRNGVCLAAMLVFAAIRVGTETAVADSDGSGGYSFDELRVACPEPSKDLFDEIDYDASGAVSPGELTDAQELEILPG